MDAIASSEARKQAVGRPSKRATTAYGFCGLLIVWLTVLAFAEIVNLSIETFEAVTNLVALSGLAILGVLFWTSKKARDIGDFDRCYRDRTHCTDPNE